MLKGNILVTGGTGFLGSHLIRTLAQNYPDCHVFGVGRNAKIGQELQQGLTNYTFVQMDLADAKSKPMLNELCEKHQFTAVVHSAALCASWSTPDAYYQANVVTTIHLADAVFENCISSLKKFVFIGSPSIFTVVQTPVVGPDTPVPDYFINEYSRTKYIAEKIILDKYCHQLGMPVIVLRPRAIYGKEDTTLLPKVLQKIAQRRVAVLKKSGQQVYTQLTHVDDVVESVICALKCDNNLAIGRAFNITGGDRVEMYELMKKLAKEVLGINMVLDSSLDPTEEEKKLTQYEVRHVPYFLLYYAGGFFEFLYSTLGWYTSDPPISRYNACVLGKSLLFDISDAVEILKYQPRVSLEQGVQEVINYTKQSNMFTASKL